MPILQQMRPFPSPTHAFSVCAYDYVRLFHPTLLILNIVCTPASAASILVHSNQQHTHRYHSQDYCKWSCYSKVIVFGSIQSYHRDIILREELAEFHSTEDGTRIFRRRNELAMQTCAQLILTVLHSVFERQFVPF